jgi:hypothetical protein
VRADVWAQRLGCDQIDWPAEEFFKEEGKVHEVVEGFLARFEFDQNIYITFGSVHIPHERTKQTIATNAKGVSCRFVLLQKLKELLFGLNGHLCNPHNFICQYGL